MIFILPVFAKTEDFFENKISDGQIVIFNQDIAMKKNKPSKKIADYYIINGGDLYNKEGMIVFSTNCDILFTKKNAIIGYNASKLKYYEFKQINDGFQARELLPEEVQNIFTHSKVIKISEFSQKTNSVKFAKEKQINSIVLVNDTEKNFENYKFYSNNTKIESTIAGMVKIHKTGMIEFSNPDKISASNWYIILIR